MNIYEKIDNISARVFGYDVGAIPGNVANVLEEVVVAGYIKPNDDRRARMANAIASACMDALVRRDYLYLSDLLEYELKPFLEEADEAGRVEP